VDYKDYYKILGVDKKSDEKNIKDAYRKLARKFHPDLNPGNKRAEEKFKEINEAYEVLSDAGKRSKYDHLGSDWNNWQQYAGQQGQPQQPGGREQHSSGGQGDFGGFQFDEDMFGGEDAGGFSDFFRTFFGGNLGNAEGRRQQQSYGGNANVEANIELDLKEAFLGGEKTFLLSVNEDCESCGGQGRLSRNASCPSCGGAGRTSKAKRLTVNIPAGIRDGSKIRIGGQGNPSGRGARGDLFLAVKIKPHSFFEVKGDDLHCEVPVALHELTLGASIDIPVFKGKVTLKIPANTQNGSVFRLKGQGLSGSSGAKGDLLVRVKALIPKTLTAKTKALFEELRKESKDDPRANIRL